MARVIIVEGYDCTGKSTLIKALLAGFIGAGLNVDTKKLGGEPTCLGQVMYWVNELYMASIDPDFDVVIFDRHTLFSAFAYQNAIVHQLETLLVELRGQVILDPELDFLYINAQMPREALIEAMSNHTGKVYDGSEHLVKIADPAFMDAAIDRYTKMIQLVEDADHRVAHYDRSVDSIYDFLSKNPEIVHFVTLAIDDVQAFYDTVIDIDIDEITSESTAVSPA